jgi:hypothetical protein
MYVLKSGCKGTRFFEHNKIKTGIL